jgi:hypothetical protein
MAETAPHYPNPTGATVAVAKGAEGGSAPSGEKSESGPPLTYCKGIITTFPLTNSYTSLMPKDAHTRARFFYSNFDFTSKN